MRTAYRCRAYPEPDQAVMLNRTFGCVRVVWNHTLAARQARYATQRRGTSFERERDHEQGDHRRQERRSIDADVEHA